MARPKRDPEILDAAELTGQDYDYIKDQMRMAEERRLTQIRRSETVKQSTFRRRQKQVNAGALTTSDKLRTSTNHIAAQVITDLQFFKLAELPAEYDKAVMAQRKVQMDDMIKQITLLQMLKKTTDIFFADEYDEQHEGVLDSEIIETEELVKEAMRLKDESTKQ